MSPGALGGPPARFSLHWWGVRFGVSAAAFALSLGAVELGLRLLGYESAAAVSSEPSLFWRRDELLGWSHEPGSSGTFVGPRPYPVEFRAPVEINSLGLRGPELEPLPAGGLRVLVLGDSLVAGFEVPYEQTFVALTQKRLARALGRPVQMVNAGVRGYGTDQELLYFRERGRLLEPQIVVYMQSTNDPEDNMTLHRMRRPFGKPAFSLRPDGSLELTGDPVPDYPLCSSWGLDARLAPRRLDGPGERAFCFVQLKVADHSALFTFTALQLARNRGLLRRLKRLVSPGRLTAWEPARLRYAGFPPLQIAAEAGYRDREAAGYALTTALVRELALEVRATGADFVWVASTREFEHMDGEALARDGIEPAILESHVDPDLPIHFRNDGHLNWRGHDLAAILLTQLLERRVRELEAGAR